MARRIRPSRTRAAIVGFALSLLLPQAAAASAPRLIVPIGVLVVGMADMYTTPFQTTLVVPAPGVLANDIGLLSEPTAQLVSGTTHGTLSLASNGGFRYQPNGGYVGADSFIYQPRDALLSGGPTAVTITVGPAPTPTPTPTPVPTPTPTGLLPSLPLPIPSVSLPPIGLPTPLPTLGLPPSPTLPALPTPTPEPAASSPPAAGASPGATDAPGSSSAPSFVPGGGGIGSVGGGVGGPGIGGIGGGTTPGGTNQSPTVPAFDSHGGSVTVGGFGGVGLGIEWLVPSVLITLPGFLLLIIGLFQVFGGFLWLPLARRWMRGDGRRQVPVANHLTR